MTEQREALEAAHGRELLWRGKAKVADEERQGVETALRPVLAELIRFYMQYEEQEFPTSDDERIEAIIERAERALRIR